MLAIAVPMVLYTSIGGVQAVAWTDVKQMVIIVTSLFTAVGVLLLATIGPALVFLKVQPQWERAIQGLVILAAVASDVVFQRRR